MVEQTDEVSRIELTAEMIAAYVSNNQVSVADLPTLIGSVYQALGRAAAPLQAPAPRPEPAVPVKKSIAPDHIVCLDDGLKFKSLKRHLRTHHGISPQQYRERWGLPASYPMVAPNYAKARSDLARKMGLGRKSG